MSQTVRTAFDGDKQEKFDYLYLEYYPYAYKIAFNVMGSSEDMEDIMQEVFSNIWKSLHVIIDDESAKAWISTISRNTATNFLKKKIARSGKIADLKEDVLYSLATPSDQNPAELVANQDNVDYIYDEIRKMGNKYADVLLMTFKFHETPERISKLLKRNPKTVYTQLSRGKELLRERLYLKGKEKQDE